jgi:hypothetical protein
MTPSGSALDPAVAVKCDLAGEVLRSFGSLRFKATGWSMLPSVWPGDTLVVKRVSRDQVGIGDIALVGRDGRLCAHRVVSVPEDSGSPQWITQGDAMCSPDRPVTENELLGVIAYVIRGGRLVAVPAQLNAVERLTAKIAGRSVPAARALVYLHRMVHFHEQAYPEKSAAKESVPCQG